MILLLMGMKDATSTHSCVWCTITKDERLLIFDTCSDIDYKWLYINSLQIVLASYIIIIICLCLSIMIAI